MAKLVVCSMFDSAIQAFGRPFVVTHIGGANRSFTDEVNNPESEICKHPTDYSLYELGTYDESTAQFDLLDEPRLVARAVDLKTSLSV